MGAGLKFQHRDVVEEFEDDFSPLLEDDSVRWDTLLVEEEQPSRHIEVEGDVSLDREVDIALVNGSEAFVLEVKTTRNGCSKAEDQVSDIVDFFEEAGYEVWGNYYLDERSEHLDAEELAREMHERFGGVFDRSDLDDFVEYQNTWGSFGYLKSSCTWDIIEFDEDAVFRPGSESYDFDSLKERGVMVDSEEGFRFSDKYRDRIRGDEEGRTFLLNDFAYEKFDIRDQR